MLQLIGRAHRLDKLIGLIPANRLIRDHLRDLSLRSRIGRYKVVSGERQVGCTSPIWRLPVKVDSQAARVSRKSSNIRSESYSAFQGWLLWAKTSNQF